MSRRIALICPYALDVNGGVQEQAMAMSRENKDILINGLTRLSRMYYVLAEAARDARRLTPASGLGLDTPAMQRRMEERLRQDGVHCGPVGHWLIARALLLHCGADAKLVAANDPQAVFASFPKGSDVLKLVSQRRQLLDYVKSRDEARYKTLIERLGIRR